MEILENYLQRGWSDSQENVSLEDIIIALDELKQIDDEHGAIWVSIIKNEENIIETHKDLNIIVEFENHERINTRLDSWNEIIELYRLLLNLEFEKIIQILKNKNYR